MKHGYRLLAHLLLVVLISLWWGHVSSARADEPCWTQSFGKPDSVITDIAMDKHGIWVAGRITEGDSSPQLWIALLDHKGQAKWQLRLPHQGYQLYPRLAPASNGHWIIAEIYRPSVPSPGGGSLTSSQVWIGQVSKAGKLTKALTLSPHRTHTVQAVSGLNDGGLLMAGTVEIGTELRGKGWLARLDAKGQLVWQRVLPQVSWLVSLQGMEQEQWLLAGQAASLDEEDDARPWLAIVDSRGQIKQSVPPNIPNFTLYAALANPDAWWLAGEWSSPRSGARLVRIERANGKIVEIPAPGFSVLRLLTQEPRGLLAGGDGLSEAPPDTPEHAPGWLTLPHPLYGDDRTSALRPAAQRLPRLPNAELRAWAWYFSSSGRRYSNYQLIGAGADPTRGAWVGCLMTSPMPADSPSIPHSPALQRKTP